MSLQGRWWLNAWGGVELRKLRPEQDIMKDWKGDASKPLVSILCLAYNHEPYIEDALEGFLIQRTDFPFEILIHDDASTDRTADIIREYEANYPNLIKPIYQRENQYSQGIRVTLTYQYPRALGKYIAMCEGDDYWTNPLKLQKQTDFLEKNSDFAICFHNMQIIYENEPRLNRISNKNQNEITTINTLACGNYIYTASCVFRNNFIILPDWFYQCPVGDYPLHLLNAQYGKIKFVNEVMGVYRIHQEGTWGDTSMVHQREKWLEMLELIRDKFDISIRNSLNKNLCNCIFKLAQHYLENNDYEKYNFYIKKIRNNHPGILFRLATQSLIVKYFFKTRGRYLF